MSPPDIGEVAASHVRQAIHSLRGTKTSIAKGRARLPRCDAEIELLLEVRKLRAIEIRLIALARKLEGTENVRALPLTQEAP